MFGRGTGAGGAQGLAIADVRPGGGDHWMAEFEAQETRAHVGFRRRRGGIEQGVLCHAGCPYRRLERVERRGREISRRARRRRIPLHLRPRANSDKRFSPPAPSREPASGERETRRGRRPKQLRRVFAP